jgi:hypothetical protein
MKTTRKTSREGADIVTAQQDIPACVMNVGV